MRCENTRKPKAKVQLEKRWLDSSDGLSDEEDDEDLKEKPQDMKCPEITRTNVYLHSDRFFGSQFDPDKKQQFTRRPNNNNAVESKIHSIPAT